MAKKRKTAWDIQWIAYLTKEKKYEALKRFNVRFAEATRLKKLKRYADLKKGLKSQKTFTFDFMQVNYPKLECARDALACGRSIEEWKLLGHASIVFEVSQSHIVRDSYFASVIITNKNTGKFKVIELPQSFAFRTFLEIDESGELFGTTLPQLTTKIMQELRAQAKARVDLGLIQQEMLRLIADVVLTQHPYVHS